MHLDRRYLGLAAACVVSGIGVAAGAQAGPFSPSWLQDPLTVAPDNGVCVGRWGVLPEGPVARVEPGTAADRDVAEGWPVFLGTDFGAFPYTPTLCDVDGDGADEIFLTGQHTFALRGDGSFLPGWPTEEMSPFGYGSTGNLPGPSVADMDGDGNWEVMWTTRDWYAGGARLWSFNGKSMDGANLSGYPREAVPTGNALWTPFVLGDADGDGFLEAWGPHTQGNNGESFRVSAFDHFGYQIFTIDLTPGEDIQSLHFGDLDGDGSSEMFAVSWLSPSVWLHVFDASGNEWPGYPVLLHTLSTGSLMFRPAVAADLDHDGDLEIIHGRWAGGFSHALCFHHDGTPYVGFPLQIGTAGRQLLNLSLGDLTGDGEPELVATYADHEVGGYGLDAFDLQGRGTLAGWPYVLPNWPKGVPAVVDVDNDGLQDVCVATSGGELYAVSGGADLIAGYPKSMVSTSTSGVAAGDIDGDGLFELVAATWDGWVYAWDTEGKVTPCRASWPMRGVDARNTGVWRDVSAGLPGDFDCDGDCDLTDYAAFHHCLGGPDVPEGIDCAPGVDADFDGDGDVDLVDFSFFLEGFTGAE